MDAEIKDILGKEFHISSENGLYISAPLMGMIISEGDPGPSKKPELPKSAKELWEIRKQKRREFIKLTLLFLFVILPLAAMLLWLIVWGLINHTYETITILIVLALLIFIFESPGDGSSGGMFIVIST